MRGAVNQSFHKAGAQISAMSSRKNTAPEREPADNYTSAIMIAFKDLEIIFSSFNAGFAALVEISGLFVHAGSHRMYSMHTDAVITGTLCDLSKRPQIKRHS